MSAYPDFQTLVEAEERGEVLRIHPSLLSQLSNCFAFLVSVFAVVLINMYCRDLPAHLNLPFGEYLSVRWLSAIPALLLLEVVRKFHNDLYIFERHRIARYGGRLSLKYQTPNIRFSDIRAIVIQQDLLGRFFGYGKIELSTAAQAEAELVISGVSSPEELAHLIERFRKYSLEIEQKSAVSTPQTVVRKAGND